MGATGAGGRGGGGLLVSRSRRSCTGVFARRSLPDPRTAPRPRLGSAHARRNLLHAEGLPVHGEPRHPQGRWGPPAGRVAEPLPDDAVPGGDVLPRGAGSARPPGPAPVDDLQVEDDAAPLGLARLHPPVQDGHRLRKGGGGRPRAVGRGQRVRAGQRAPGEAVAPADVLLQFVGGGSGLELGEGNRGRGGGGGGGRGGAGGGMLGVTAARGGASYGGL